MFESEGEYFSIRMPIELNTERIVTKYRDIIFDRNGKPIKVKLIESFRNINYPEEGVKILYSLSELYSHPDKLLINIYKK